MRQVAVFMAFLIVVACSSSRKSGKEKEAPYIFETNTGISGASLVIEFTRGEAFNHPLMAIWVEDMDSNYVETLFVAESIGKGVFKYGDKSSGKWQPGEIRRPAALPYWGHKRGIRAADGYYLPTPNNPVPDAITGPTPQGDFAMKTHIKNSNLNKFRLLFEINQSWDWNEYWTNSKYPDDEHYKTSSQPAVIYEAIIDLDGGQEICTLEAIGHSHYSGKNGTLYKDLSTLTTALKIVDQITVRVVK